MEDWAEICRLHRAEGMAIRAIARRLEISRNAVKKAVTSYEPPRYERAAEGSAVDGFEPQVRALLAEFPEMPTSVIMERVGWARGKSVSFERVARLRPLCQPADVPLGWGQAARLPVLVMVSGYSRMIAAVVIPHSEDEGRQADLALVREPIGSLIGSRNSDLKIPLTSRDGGI